jgi:conjugative relaxase-like TrwC/TraI family protein
MLSIAKLADVEYHAHISREDLYHSKEQTTGRWFGAAANKLGLYGEVKVESLRSLFAGYGVDGRKLVQNAGRDGRRVGWDLTFSAPKSISILWAVANPRIRAIIEGCHDESVDFALTTAERHAGWARFGKAGRFLSKAALVFAIFRHGTTRALDPSLHSHALLANVGVCENGATGALLSKVIFCWKMASIAITWHFSCNNGWAWSSSRHATVLKHVAFHREP